MHARKKRPAYISVVASLQRTMLPTPMSWTLKRHLRDQRMVSGNDPIGRYILIDFKT